MKNELDRVKKVDKSCRKVTERADKHDDQLSGISQNFETFGNLTEQRFNKLEKALRDETSTRALENKKIKSVAGSIEKSVTRSEFDNSIALKNSELQIRQDILEVGARFDKKSDAFEQAVTSQMEDVSSNISRTI